MRLLDKSFDDLFKMRSCWMKKFKPKAVNRSS